MKVKVEVFKLFYDLAEVVETLVPGASSTSSSNASVMAGAVFIDDRMYGRATVKWDFTGETEWVEGTSTTGNFARVEKVVDSHWVTFSFVGARHAMRNCGNEAGAIFASLFTAGERWSGKLNMEALESAKVLEYESWRTDAPWWECGLLPEPPGEKFEEFQQIEAAPCWHGRQGIRL